MELLNYLPDRSTLSHTSFRTWDKKRDERRIALVLDHSVGCKMGDRVMEGTSEITYIIQVPKVSRPVSRTLHVAKTAVSIAVQSPDVVRSLTEAYRPRMSYALSEVGDGMFDMRALAYVLGGAVAAGASNTAYTYESGIVGAKLLSPTWTVPGAGELTVGPGVVTDKREHVTLMKLADSAGVRSAQYIADALPPSRARLLQGPMLASFGLRLFSVLMLSAQGCGSGDHHIEAFFRGMTSVYSLWAHNDEGGWMRSFLKEADYPPSTGVLATTGSTCCGVPARSNVPVGEVTRYSLALYLRMVGLIPVADSFRSGKPSLFTREEGENACPSSFEGLEEKGYEVMDRWRTLAAEAFDLHESQVLDGHSSRTFFAADKVDLHLDNKVIIPFWWVEPAPLFRGNSGKLEMPCAIGAQVKMKFAKTSGVLHPPAVEDYRGCFVRGTPVRVKLEQGSLRMHGFSYLLSAAYRPENGLTTSRYVRSEKDGVYTTEALFVEPGVVSASDRRWVTPHNPIPNPAEGYTTGPSMLEYLYYGRGVEPTISGWSTSEVVSTCSYFRMGSAGVMGDVVTHKHVPEALLSLVDKYAVSATWIAHEAVTFADSSPNITNPPLEPSQELEDKAEATVKIIDPDALPKEEMPAPTETVPLLADAGEAMNFRRQNPPPEEGQYDHSETSDDHQEDASETSS